MNKEIEEMVRTFNNGWLQKDMEKLKAVLHEKVVFMAPDMKSMLQGREACAATVEAYNNQAVTHDFRMHLDSVHCIGQSGWLTLSYDIDYEMKEKRYKEHGVVIWGVLRRNDQWLLAWRCLAASSETA
jgi:ketosteroid isomerase-like protein